MRTVQLCKSVIVMGFGTMDMMDGRQGWSTGYGGYAGLFVLLLVVVMVLVLRRRGR